MNLNVSILNGGLGFWGWPSSDSSSSSMDPTGIITAAGSGASNNINTSSGGGDSFWDKAWNAAKGLISINTTPPPPANVPVVPVDPWYKTTGGKVAIGAGVLALGALTYYAVKK